MADGKRAVQDLERLAISAKSRKIPRPSATLVNRKMGRPDARSSSKNVDLV